ncbi:MAG: hypothetical protein ABIP76_06255 [Verrucomicrobiota bacterium]
MASKEYIERLQMVRGETVWKGDVEVFYPTGHPRAQRCYGWFYGEPGAVYNHSGIAARDRCTKRGKSRRVVSHQTSAK